MPPERDEFATPEVHYSTSTVGRFGPVSVQRLFGAVRDKSHLRGADALDDDIDCLHIRYPSYQTKWAKKNAAYGAFFNFHSPEGDRASWKLLNRCLTDTEGEHWLSHAKIIYTAWWDRFPGRILSPSPVGRWLYMGSHSLSEAAWSRQHFECGVVFPIPTSAEEAGIAISIPTGGRVYPVPEAEHEYF